MKQEADKSLIELFMWIIAYEISKERVSKADDNEKFLIDVLHKMCKLLSNAYGISINNSKLMSESHIKLAKRITNFYYDNFKEVSEDDGDGAVKLIDFPLTNGKFGREFEDVKQIGSGSFGDVCSALNVIDREHYAIKKVQLYEKMHEKVLNEVIIWAKVRSPYIVQYKSSWTENNNNNHDDDASEGVTESSRSVTSESPWLGHILYIQMELCGIQIGGKVIRTLRDAIGTINNELDQKMGELITYIGAFIASRLIEEIINGVEYLHSLKPPIIHRDLKPSNILITDGSGGNFIKIGDLGFATSHGNSNDSVASGSMALEHTRNKGSHGYIAPEVRNSMSYTEKCDAFSLGRIIMDLFCIEKPESDDEQNKVSEICMRYNLHFQRKFSRLALGMRILMYINSIKGLTQLKPENRYSIEGMIRFRDKRCIRSNNIVGVLPNVHDLSKTIKDRLSSYIVMDTLNRELRNPQLTQIEFQKQSTNSDKVFTARLSWLGKDQYMDIREAICEDKIKFETNINDDDLKKIMPFIKKGFSIHASKKPISVYIEKNITKCLNLPEYRRGRRRNCICIIEFLENTYEQRNWIPWMSEMKYLYAFHTFTQHKRDLLILINYVLCEGVFPLPNWKQIIEPDTKNGHISSTLKQIIPKIKYHNDDQHVFLNNDDDVHLKQIRSVIGNQSAFCYITNKSRKFFIYYTNCSFNIRCVYATVNGLFQYVIFTLEPKDTNHPPPYPLCIKSTPMKRKKGKGHDDYRIIKLDISELTKDDHHKSPILLEN